MEIKDTEDIISFNWQRLLISNTFTHTHTHTHTQIQAHKVRSVPFLSTDCHWNEYSGITMVAIVMLIFDFYPPPPKPSPLPSSRSPVSGILPSLCIQSAG